MVALICEGVSGGALGAGVTAGRETLCQRFCALCALGSGDRFLFSDYRTVAASSFRLVERQVGAMQAARHIIASS